MLSHIRVVEIADGLGAYAGRILASLGASVTKVEPPGGESSRRTGAPAKGPAMDATLDWVAWNTGKASVTADASTPAGRQKIAALLETADMLIQGGGDGLAQAGLSYEVLARSNPGLISVIVAPFAEASAQAGAAATDLTLMAMSGIMNMVGDPDRPPLKLPGQQAYALAGIQGAIAALTALNARAANAGRGERVWVSAYQAAVLAGYRDPIVWEWTGRIGQRTGNRLVRGKSGVRQVWPAKDGFVTWSIVDNPGMVKGMVALMADDGAAGPLAEVDWDNTLVADAPQAQIDAWEAVIEPWFRTKAKADLAKASAERGLGLSQIDTPDEAMASPHWAARRFWQRLDDPARGLHAAAPGPLYLTTAMEPLALSPAPAAEA
jgi:crotonobetainyl-CoA:carnitine CoA-transferase CaiB-like acyl-CoA transferase